MRFGDGVSGGSRGWASLCGCFGPAWIVVRIDGGFGWGLVLENWEPLVLLVGKDGISASLTTMQVGMVENLGSKLGNNFGIGFGF